MRWSVKPAVPLTPHHCIPGAPRQGRDFRFPSLRRSPGPSRRKRPALLYRVHTILKATRSSLAANFAPQSAGKPVPGVSRQSPKNNKELEKRYARRASRRRTRTAGRESPTPPFWRACVPFRDAVRPLYDRSLAWRKQPFRLQVSVLVCAHGWRQCGCPYVATNLTCVRRMPSSSQRILRNWSSLTKGEIWRQDG